MLRHATELYLSHGSCDLKYISLLYASICAVTTLAITVSFCCSYSTGPGLYGSKPTQMMDGLSHGTILWLVESTSASALRH